MWVDPRLTSDQQNQLSELAGFLGGAVYDQVAVIRFAKIVDDLKIREILHPLPFICQGNRSNTMFRTNLNPTPEQMPAIKRFMDMAQGRIPYGLNYTPIQKRLK